MAKEIDLVGSISTRFSVHGFNNTRKRPKSVIKKLVNLKGANSKEKRRNRLDFNYLEDKGRGEMKRIV